MPASRVTPRVAAAAAAPRANRFPDPERQALVSSARRAAAHVTGESRAARGNKRRGGGKSEMRKIRGIRPEERRAGAGAVGIRVVPFAERRG